MQNLKAVAILYPLETFNFAFMALLLRFFGSLSSNHLKKSLCLLLVVGEQVKKLIPPQRPMLQGFNIHTVWLNITLLPKLDQSISSVPLHSDNSVRFALFRHAIYVSEHSRCYLFSSSSNSFQNDYIHTTAKCFVQASLMKEVILGRVIGTLRVWVVWVFFFCTPIFWISFKWSRRSEMRRKWRSCLLKVH